ncbi:MAG: stage III sporulation protein AG [Oscillospiraceae bacterium]
MKNLGVWRERGGALLARLKEYRFVLLILLAGVLLLLLPNPTKKEEKIQGGAETEFSVAALEKKLAQSISKMEGAGETTVVLTVQGGTRRELARDGSTSTGDGQQEQQSSTVVVSTGSGTQDAVLVQRLYPRFQGALVLCPGGGTAAVRLKVTEALSALTGLGADKIVICKSR